MKDETQRLSIMLRMSDVDISSVVYEIYLPLHDNIRLERGCHRSSSSWSRGVCIKICINEDVVGHTIFQGNSVTLAHSSLCMLHTKVLFTALNLPRVIP